MKILCKDKDFLQKRIPFLRKISPIAPFLQFFSHFCYKMISLIPFLNNSRHSNATSLETTSRVCRIFATLSPGETKKVEKKFGAYSKNLYLCTVKIKETTLDETNDITNQTLFITKQTLLNTKRIMKKLFFAAAIMMASVSAFAQHEAGDITLQARVGMIGADFNNTSDTKARVGLVVGPELEYFMTDRFSLGAGVTYSQQGAELDNSSDVTYNVDYITMPITANYYIWKGLAVRAGVQPGFNVSAKIKHGDEKVDMGDDVKGFDFAIPVGLSYEFRHFVIDARYTFGLTEIFDTKKVDLDSKNLSFQLSLAYKFNLKH